MEKMDKENFKKKSNSVPIVGNTLYFIILQFDIVPQNIILILTARTNERKNMDGQKKNIYFKKNFSLVFPT